MTAIFVPNICLRPIQEDDLPAILEIEQATHICPWSLQIFKDCLLVGYTTCLLELDDYIVGYGLLSVGAEEAHILNLCVHPHFQRCGYGKLLIKHLLTRAKQQKVKTVFLDVRVSNQAAINLYLQLGFNEIGRRKNYYFSKNRHHEDALIFALELFSER
jgi:ribosomal-protein-alanine N-acetyltransferase